MEIYIRHIKDNKLSWERTIIIAQGNFMVVERISCAILKHLFLYKKANLITIQPQKYSLGYELTKYRKFKVSKKEILLNEIDDCDEELLEDIVQWEEFKRTLLIMISGEAEVSTTLISEIMSLISSPLHTLSFYPAAMFAYCEDDGNSLYLYNSTLTLDELETLANEIL